MLLTHSKFCVELSWVMWITAYTIFFCNSQFLNKNYDLMTLFEEKNKLNDLNYDLTTLPETFCCSHPAR